MKKSIILVAVLFSITVAIAETDYFVVEQESPWTDSNPLVISGGEEVIDAITFTVPNNGHVVFYLDGHLDLAGTGVLSCDTRLYVDGEMIIKDNPTPRAIALDAGQHTLELRCYVIGCTATISYFWTQLMVFYHVESAVLEGPEDSGSTIDNPSVLVSKAPMVYVPGCTELYDKSGRKVECTIEDGWVQLDGLSAGTFFAKQADGGSVKIVTVK